MLTLLLLLSACTRKEPPPPAPAPAAAEEAVDDPENLLTIMSGAAVISRNYELHLESSVAHALDADVETFWIAPGGVREMTAVIALAARSRIARVAVTVPGRGGFAPRAIRFESSLDGKQWSQFASIAPKAVALPQTFRVTPTDAAFVRVTPSDAAGVIGLRSLDVFGAELERPSARSLDGCWTINGLPAKFVQNGSRVIGVIGNEQPMYIDGGTDGRFFRFLWTKHPQYGFAAVSVSPDGQHLSGLRWHEEPISLFAGDGWFGVRGPCSTADLSRADVLGTFNGRAGRYPLFGLRFDDRDRLDPRENDAALNELAAIIAKTKHVSLEASEFREATPEKNRARTQKRIDALRAALAVRGVDMTRIRFDAAGTAPPPHIPRTSAMRAMYASIDLRLQ